MTLQKNNDRNLIVVIGATGVGKSAYALSLAQELNTEIISADSRQIFRGMSIGTDAPTPSDLASVPHHFIATREVSQPYSADQFAKDADAVLEQIFLSHTHAVMVGGSMMYLQAFLEGLDPIPESEPAIRAELWHRFSTEGVVGLREELQAVDPDYLERIDPNNHKRIIRALEVYHTTGQRFTDFHKRKQIRIHPYAIEIHNITRPREQLYERINLRVSQMFKRGLVEEVQALETYRHENALNTIGYKEVFEYLDGQISLQEAERQIAKHSRVYARQQITFFRRWTGSESPFNHVTIEL